MPAYLFGIQVITGIILAFYYVPEPSRAYESVWRITYDVPLGWWVRALHKWSANLMIITASLHAFRVFFTGAYRAPRELTWIFGAILLVLTLFLGFTGYSLVYEQLAYWGATVATNLTEAVPLIGVYIARFIRGGDVVGPDTLSRFYIFHVGILPTFVLAFVAVHIILVRTHGVTELHFKDEKPAELKTFRFFPDHILTELMVGIVILIVISAVAVIFPLELQERADPLTTPAHIKPEWYFYFTFRWLKLTGLTVAVLTLGLAGFVFMVWPLAESWIKRYTKRDIAIPLGILAVIGIVALTLWEALAH
jgi:ubiquinol-cytochrome c reductase cytochrome b subunit/cytochrome b6